MYSFCQRELPSAVQTALGSQVDLSRVSVCELLAFMVLSILSLCFYLPRLS